MTRRAQTRLQTHLAVTLVIGAVLLAVALPACSVALRCDMPCCADPPAEAASCRLDDQGHPCQRAAAVTTSSSWTVALPPAASAPTISIAMCGVGTGNDRHDIRPTVLRLHVLLSVFRI